MAWPPVRVLFGALWWIAAVLDQQCGALPLDWNTAGPQEVWGPAVASAALLVTCAVLALLGCVCCRHSKTPAFQEFNDTTSNHSLSTAGFVNPLATAATPASASTEFTIFPPPGVQLLVPPPASTSTVLFEPLPDIRPKPPSTPLRPAAAFSNAEVPAELTDGPSFPRDRLKYLRELGQGWFGKVVEGEALTEEGRCTPVVVRILREDAPAPDQALFLREVGPLRALSHPNLVKVLGCCLEARPLLTIMELCPGGDLKNYLLEHRTEAAELGQQGTVVRMMSDVAAGLHHMAQAGFVHTDLAARTCLLGADLSVRVGDYGTSINSFREEYYCVGDVALPIRWCAPETLDCTDDITIHTKEVTRAANVWTLGVVLWEVAQFGLLPHANLTDEEVLSLELSQRVLPPLSDHLLPHAHYLYQLMLRCWQSESERPSAEEVLGLLLHVRGGGTTCDESFEQRWTALRPNPRPTSLSLSDTATPCFSKLQSPSLHDLRSFQGTPEGNLRSSSLPASTELLHVEEVSLEMDEDARRINEAIQDLDDALALEKTSSSSEQSSPHPTPKPSQNSVLDFRLSDSEEEGGGWRGRIERGELSEKVRQKSVSVQDLMVLTHIESSSSSDGECAAAEPCRSESNICRAVVVEGLLDSFRQMHKLAGPQMNQAVTESRGSAPEFLDQYLISPAKLTPSNTHEPVNFSLSQPEPQSQGTVLLNSGEDILLESSLPRVTASSELFSVQSLEGSIETSSQSCSVTVSSDDSQLTALFNARLSLESGLDVESPSTCVKSSPVTAECDVPQDQAVDQDSLSAAAEAGDKIVESTETVSDKLVECTETVSKRQLSDHSCSVSDSSSNIDLFNEVTPLPSKACDATNDSAALETVETYIESHGIPATLNLENKTQNDSTSVIEPVIESHKVSAVCATPSKNAVFTETVSDSPQLIVAPCVGTDNVETTKPVSELPVISITVYDENIDGVESSELLDSTSDIQDLPVISITVYDEQSDSAESRELVETASDLQEISSTPSSQSDSTESREPGHFFQETTPSSQSDSTESRELVETVSDIQENSVTSSSPSNSADLGHSDKDINTEVLSGSQLMTGTPSSVNETLSDNITPEKTATLSDNQQLPVTPDVDSEFDSVAASTRTTSNIFLAGTTSDNHEMPAIPVTSLSNSLTCLEPSQSTSEILAGKSSAESAMLVDFISDSTTLVDPSPIAIDSHDVSAISSSSSHNASCSVAPDNKIGDTDSSEENECKASEECKAGENDVSKTTMEVCNSAADVLVQVISGADMEEAQEVVILDTADTTRDVQESTPTKLNNSLQEKPDVESKIVVRPRLGQEPLSMIAFEPSHPKHHGDHRLRKIKEKDFEFSKLKCLPTLSSDTVGMIAFNPSTCQQPPPLPPPPLDTAVLADLSAGVACDPVVSLPPQTSWPQVEPVSQPSTNLCVSLPAGERLDEDEPEALSTIAFEYVQHESSECLSGTTSAASTPNQDTVVERPELFKPKRLEQLCEEALILDIDETPKVLEQASMEAIILDVDSTNLAEEICKQRDECDGALTRLDSLLRSESWSRSDSGRSDDRRGTPDDERSSDSGFRERGDGDKYKLEDIEVELTQLGTPSSDSGLERTPHDELKSLDSRDEGDEFWQQQMASLQQAAGKTLALFQEAAGADLSPCEEEKVYANSWFRRSEEDGDNSYVSFGLDDECVAAIRSELQQKLPQLERQGSDEELNTEGEEEIKREDITIHYNIYPVPLSPILEEQESLASSEECSPCHSPALVHGMPSSGSSSRASSPHASPKPSSPHHSSPVASSSPTHQNPTMSPTQRTESQFEADIRQALAQCDSAGMQQTTQEEDDNREQQDDEDVLLVNTETNEATLVESPMRPKLPYLAFVNGQRVLSGGDWVEDDWKSETSFLDQFDAVTSFSEPDPEDGDGGTTPSWMTLPLTRAPMPSPEDEQARRVGEPAPCNTPEWEPTPCTPDWESEDSASEGSSSSGEFVWREGESSEAMSGTTRQEDDEEEEGHQPTTPCKPFESVSEFPMSVIEEEDEDSDSSDAEFVPSSWNSEATPSRSSLRSPDKRTVDPKKNVSFKREKYHCVYEYPREACSDTEEQVAVQQQQQPTSTQPGGLDYASYADWEMLEDELGCDSAADQDTDPDISEHAKPEPFDFYKLSSIECDFSNGLNEDGEFFISSSARPFHLNTSSFSSQFFPGLAGEVESPGGSSSSSGATPPSPLSPTMGELRHTRDKLRLDLPSFSLSPKADQSHA